MNPYIAAWIGLAVFGFFLSSYLAYDSWQDIRALGRDGNGKRAVARSRFVRESLRVSVHIVYFGIGAPFLYSPAEFSLTVAGLMWGAAVLVINSFVDVTTRHLAYEVAEDQVPETIIQRQDREVGDQRRELQERDNT